MYYIGKKGIKLPCESIFLVKVSLLIKYDFEINVLIFLLEKPLREIMDYIGIYMIYIFITCCNIFKNENPGNHSFHTFALHHIITSC